MSIHHANPTAQGPCDDEPVDLEGLASLVYSREPQQALAQMRLMSAMSAAARFFDVYKIAFTASDLAAAAAAMIAAARDQQLMDLRERELRLRESRR